MEQSGVAENVADPEQNKENKKLKKKFMKEGVAMAQSYIKDTLNVDAAIVNIEILIDASMVAKSDGCIVACFLDAGCDKVAISGGANVLLQALEDARVPRDRLVAHFDSPSVPYDLIPTIMNFTDTISVAYDSTIPQEECKALMDRIGNAAGSEVQPKDITVHIQLPSSTFDSDPDLVSSISKYCSEKETPKGTISLIDPTAHQLGMSFASCIRTDREDGLYTTVVCTRTMEALGLVYSSKESIVASIECGRGVYYSRSRMGLWRKGDTSGHYQNLHKIDVDCDGDALRFIVTQRGDAFCHLNTLTCWGEPNGIRHLQQTLKSRLEDAPQGSYTKRLFDDPELLRDKLVEEAQELSEAETKQHVAEELADVLYFAMVKAAKAGVSIDDAVSELEKRTRKVTRRKGDSKAFRIEAGNKILKK